MQYFDKIMILLKKQGKKADVKRILSIRDSEKQKQAFEEWILSESYYITDIDIWVLAQERSLPIILFTSTSLKNLLEGVDWIIMGKNDKVPKFYFIRAYATIDKSEYHDYHIITPPLRITDLRQFKRDIDEKLNGIGANNFIEEKNYFFPKIFINSFS
jgi:hypothetical protein